MLLWLWCKKAGLDPDPAAGCWPRSLYGRTSVDLARNLKKEDSSVGGGQGPSMQPPAQTAPTNAKNIWAVEKEWGHSQWIRNFPSKG